MKSLFIIALENVELELSIARGIRFVDTHFITNNKQTVLNLITSDFRFVFGEMETQHILDAPAVIYSIVEHKEPFPNELAAVTFLSSNLKLVQAFLMCLWLQKDNSVNFDLGFLVHPYGDKSIPNFHSSSRNVRFSNAIGEIVVTKFGESEIKTARNILTNLFGMQIDYEDLKVVQSIFGEEVSRVERSFYFAQIARGSSNFGLKVANYVTCFESIFCTDTAELSHKLAERLALFVGDSETERLDIYKNMKRAYNIRSKIVHGDKVSKKSNSEFKDICLYCDNMLRRTFEKILTSKEEIEFFKCESSELEEYFLRLLFNKDQEKKSNR
ncbi:MAG: hypothetical protein ACREBV_03210 [Candidatus Zixiibacteriota bacterium]